MTPPAAQGTGSYDAASLPPAIRWQVPDHPVPLSIAQAESWKLIRLLPATSLYVINLVMEISGTIDEGALMSAFDRVVERYDALRVRVVDGEGDDAKMVARDASWDVQRVDLAHRMPADAGEIAKTAIARFRGAVRDIRHQSPLNVLFVAREDTAVLGVSLHHLVSDAWSFDLILRDVAAGYASAVRGIVPHQPDAPSFLAYAEDESQSASSPRILEAAAQWAQRIAESQAVPVRFVPDDRRPGVLMSELRMRFEGVTERLDRLAVRLDSTRFAVVLAALVVAVEARTGSAYPRIAIHTANRNRPGSESMVGLLANTHLAEVDRRDDIDFAELVRRTMRAVVSGNARGGVPFQRICSALEDAGISPAEVMPRLECRWQESPFTTVCWGGATVRLLKEATGPDHSAPTFRLTTSDLITTFTRHGSDLILELLYKIDILSAQEVDAFAAAFSAALDVGLNDAHRPVSEIVRRLAAPSERGAIAPPS